jgi:hypothetical protein
MDPLLLRSMQESLKKFTQFAFDADDLLLFTHPLSLFHNVGGVLERIGGLLSWDFRRLAEHDIVSLFKTSNL